MSTRIWVEKRPALDALYALDSKASHHVQVLRKKVGSKLVLFDGKEGEFTGVITNIEKRLINVHVQGYLPINRTPHRKQIVLIADCAMQKMSWIVQKATELGVFEIQPITCIRSKSKAASTPIFQEKQARLVKVAISAAEQCGLNRLPHIQQSVDLEKALINYKDYPCFVGDTQGSSTEKLSLKKDEVVWIIGPEGGWHEEEILIFNKYNVQKVRYCDTILRMETAVIVALSLGLVT